MSSAHGVALTLVSDPATVSKLDRSGSGRVLAVTAAAWRALARAGIPAAMLDEVAPLEETWAAKDFGHDIARSFATLAGGEDLSSWRGDSLAQLIEFEVWWAIAIPVARCAVSLRAALEGAGSGIVLHDLVPGIEADVARCLAGERLVDLRDAPRAGGAAAAIDDSLLRPVGYSLASALHDAHGLNVSRLHRWSFYNGLARLLNPEVVRRKVPPTVLIASYTSLAPALEWISRGATNGLRFLFSGSPPRRLLLGLARRGVRRLVVREEAEAAREAQPVAARVVEGLHGALRERFRLLDLDLAPVLAPRLAALTVELPKLAGLLAGTEAALREEHVGLVVLPTDGSLRQRLQVFAARRAGIPTLVTLHGFPGHFYDDRLVDHLAVYSDPIRRLYLAAGFEPARVHVLPSPAFARLSPSPPPGPEAPLLVLTCARYTTQTRAVERGSDVFLGDVLAAIREAAPASRVTIKLHPLEVPAEYEEILAAAGRPADGTSTRLVHRGDVAAEIARARVVIGPFSTASLETVLVGRPYVAYFPPPHAPPPWGRPFFDTLPEADGLLPFASGGDGEPCRTREELVLALRAALVPGAPPRAAALARWAGVRTSDPSAFFELLRRLVRVGPQRAPSRTA